MTASPKVFAGSLVEIPCPYEEPLFRQGEPRKASNLTLIDGKTFLSTTVSGDVGLSQLP